MTTEIITAEDEEDEIALQQEFAMWEAASVEDYLKLERLMNVAITDRLNTSGELTDCSSSH